MVFAHMANLTWFQSSNKARANACAGTFLYAACVHILPEVMQSGVFTSGQVGMLTLGAGLPILLSAWHGDHHH